MGLTRDNINKLCKIGKVSVEINVYDREDEEIVIPWENNRIVKQPKQIFGVGQEIRCFEHLVDSDYNAWKSIGRTLSDQMKKEIV